MQTFSSIFKTQCPHPHIGAKSQNPLMEKRTAIRLKDRFKIPDDKHVKLK